MAVYSQTEREHETDLANTVTVGNAKHNTATAWRVVPFFRVPEKSGSDLTFRKPGDKVLYVKDRAPGTPIKPSYITSGKATWTCSSYDASSAVDEDSEPTYIYPGVDPKAAIDAVNASVVIEGAYAIPEQQLLNALVTALGGSVTGNALEKGAVIAAILNAREKIRRVCEECVMYTDTETFDKLCQIDEVRDYLYRKADITNVVDFLNIPADRQAEALTPVLGVDEIVVYGDLYRPATVPAGTIFFVGRAKGTVEANQSGNPAEAIALAKTKIVPLALTYTTVVGQDPKSFVDILTWFDKMTTSNIMLAKVKSGAMPLVCSEAGHPGVEFVTINPTPGTYNASVDAIDYPDSPYADGAAAE